MSVTAVCTGCQKTFKAPDEFAGKKVRCKQCGTAFRIPGGAVVAAAAAAAPVTKRQPVGAATSAKRPAAKPVEPAFPDDDQGEYGLSDDDLGLHGQEVAAARPYNPSAVAAAPAYAAPAAGASRGTTSTMYPSIGTTVAGRHGGTAPSAGANWVLYAQLGAFGLPLLLLLMGKLVPALATLGILSASFIAMGFIIWGQIGMLIAASQEGSVTLLLYLFLPFYPLFFILSHLDDVMPSLLRTLAGFALMAGAIMMILSQAPR